MTKHESHEKVLTKALNGLREDLKSKQGGSDIPPALRSRLAALDERFSALQNENNALREKISRYKTEYLDLKERFTETQSMAGMALWEWDARTNAITWSGKLYSIYGYEKNDFTPTRYSMLLCTHPDDISDVRRAVQDAIESKKMKKFSRRIIDARGNIRILKERIKPVFDENGILIKTRGIVKDITERVEEGERARQLAAIVEHSDDVIISLATDGTITSWNSAAERLLGYTAVDVLGNPIEAYLPEIAHIDLTHQVHHEHPGHDNHTEMAIKNAEGDLVDVAIQFSPIRNMDNAVIGASAIVHNITERKKLERKLENNARELEHAVKERTRDLAGEKQHMEAILKSIVDGVIVIGVDMKVTRANDSAGYYLKWDADDMIGRSLDEVAPLFNDKDQPLPHEGIQERVLAKGEQIATLPPSRYRYKRKDGVTIPISLTASPIIIDNVIVGATMVFRDITKGKQLDKAKNEFISLASHQLRTPPSIIGMYTEMLLAEKKEMNSEHASFVEEVHLANKRMMELINNLLHVSKIELGALEVAKKDYLDVDSTIQKITRNLQAYIEEKEQKLQLNVDPDLPLVWTNQAYVEILLENLITNAIKYTPKHGKIDVAAHQVDDALIVNVSDTGFGIPKDEQEQIFTKLFRAKNAKYRVSEGTGLGLYIAHSIADQLGGSITFESEEDKGTTFTVTLPMEKENKNTQHHS